MTFQELLLNLMGTHTSKRLKVIADEWEGELLIKNDEIQRAEIYNNPELSGIKALKFMLDHQNSIEKVEFLPFESNKTNMKLNQMELLNIVWEEQEEELNKTEEIIENPFLTVLTEYFSEGSIKAVIYGKNISASGKENRELTEVIKTLVENLKEQAPCEPQKLLVKFENSFCLILIGRGNYGAVVIDMEELPNYELDQPAIDEELLSALTAED